MDKIIKDLMEDYKRGDSLNSLSKKYKIPKSTIYYNLSKINLIRKQNLVFKLKSNNKLIKGTFIGFWIGDGSKFYKRRYGYTIKFYFHKKDVELVKFVRYLILKLFGKGIINYTSFKDSNKATIRYYSKFIYNFIDKYVSYERNKTLTIRLKEKHKNYSEEFIKGLLLGLTLSDGYIKNKYVFTSISKYLMNDICLILKQLNYNPYLYNEKIHGYGKHPLYRLVLSSKETLTFENFLNKAIFSCGCDDDIKLLKGYK